MAKPITTTDSTTNASDDSNVAEKPQLTKEQKQKLFKDYDAAEKALSEAKAKVEALTIARSKCVEKIATDIGTGPFQYGGRTLTVTKRNDNYFFKGPSQNKVEEI